MTSSLEIASRIEAFCQTNNLSVSAMLSSANLDKSVISTMKSKRKSMPSADKVLAIASVLDISVDELLTGIRPDYVVGEQEAALLALFRSLPTEQKSYFVSSLRGAVDALDKQG